MKNWNQIIGVLFIQSALAGLFCLLFMPWAHALLAATVMLAVGLLWEAAGEKEWDWLRGILCAYMFLRYGCRGALRPPVAPPLYWSVRFDTKLRRNWPSIWWYLWRRTCWRIEDRIYQWTGLPDRWNHHFGRTLHSEKLGD